MLAPRIADMRGIIALVWNGGATKTRFFTPLRSVQNDS